MPDSQDDRMKLKDTLYQVIFEADTPAGKWFDIVLLLSILASVAVVMADSVGTMRASYGGFLSGAEWFFTILFTVEYILRLYSVRRPLSYAGSFFGVVDFLAIIPTYLSLFFPSTRFFLILRTLRLLRVFRILKLVQFLREANLLLRALSASRRKILVFLSGVLILVTLSGSLMYLIEGEANGFTSIPTSIYWAIVTMTTVGYGDISPQTPLGQVLASFLMILGFSIIAVPTGIVTAQMGYDMARGVSPQACPGCGRQGHDADAVFCKYCGERI